MQAMTEVTFLDNNVISISFRVNEEIKAEMSMPISRISLYHMILSHLLLFGRYFIIDLKIN